MSNDEISRIQDGEQKLMLYHLIDDRKLGSAGATGGECLTS